MNTEEYVADLKQHCLPSGEQVDRTATVSVMNLDGYMARVSFLLEGLGVTERPTESEFVAAWASQVCAKKMAATFKRRRHKRIVTS